MSETWSQIIEFPNYAVSNLGRVQNVMTGREMRLSFNQRGILFVGLMKDGIQYKRSVPLLVASHFLQSPIHESFDSVIQLDGDRGNCRATNLMWRPYHFTVNYMRQTRANERLIKERVYCPETDETFPNSLAMAMKYGLLQTDILYSAVNGVMIWPTKLTASVHGL